MNGGHGIQLAQSGLGQTMPSSAQTPELRFWIPNDSKCSETSFGGVAYRLEPWPATSSAKHEAKKAADGFIMTLNCWTGR